MALQMSMQEESTQATTTPAEAPATTTSAEAMDTTAPSDAGAGVPQFMDPDFVRSILGTFQGVDPSHPSIRAALEQVKKKKKNFWEGQKK